jgi:hypothetical protein
VTPEPRIELPLDEGGKIEGYSTDKGGVLLMINDGDTSSSWPRLTKEEAVALGKWLIETSVGGQVSWQGSLLQAGKSQCNVGFMTGQPQ